MSGNRHRRPPGRPVHLSLLVLAAAALARALSDRGGAVRVASLLLHQLGRTPSHSPRAATYRVGESRPWHDFERQARLLGAPWGPCRSGNAGL